VCLFQSVHHIVQWFSDDSWGHLISQYKGNLSLSIRSFHLEYKLPELVCHCADSRKSFLFWLLIVLCVMAQKLGSPKWKAVNLQFQTSFHKPLSMVAGYAFSALYYH